MSVRFRPVTLLLTHYRERRSFTVDLYAVHLRQRRPRRGHERLQWTLLTTYPIRSLEDAKLVIANYTKRWRVEEFHRTWKRGACQLERSQLRSRQAFRRWATILAAVAARIERLKRLSRTEPDRDALDEFSRAELDSAIVLSATRKFQPGDGLTLQQAVWLVAEAGGYTGKSSGGPPGSTTIGRGLAEVEAAAAVVERLKM